MVFFLYTVTNVDSNDLVYIKTMYPTDSKEIFCTEIRKGFQFFHLFYDKFIFFKLKTQDTIEIHETLTTSESTKIRTNFEP